VSQTSHCDDELGAAKASAEKLQDAATGGTPVALPGGFTAGSTPEPPPAPHPSAVPSDTPQPAASEDDLAKSRLEGGGRI